MKKYIKFIVLTLVAVLIFWLFGRNLNWSEVWASTKQANPTYVIGGVLVIWLGYLLRAKRWQVLLEPITQSSLKELFATTTVGFTAVFLVGRAGEIVRPVWLPMRDKRVRPSAALVTIGVERIFDFAAIICFFSFNLIWISAPAGREQELRDIRIIGFFLIVAVVLGFTGLFVYQRNSLRIIGFFERMMDRVSFPRRVRRIIISIMKQLAKSLDILKDWREILLVTFWTLLLWGSIAVPTWFVLLAFDLPLGITDALFVMGFSAIGSVFPTPGGAAGAFHATTAAGLMFLGIPKELALAVAFVMHFVYFAPAVIFGLYYFVRGDLSFSGFREMLESDPAASIGEGKH